MTQEERIIGTIPDQTSWDDKSMTATVRQYHIDDFVALIQRIDTQDETRAWQHLIIYADTIDAKTSKRFGIDLADRTSITIVARRFNIMGAGRLFFHNMDPHAGTEVKIRVQNVASNSDKPPFVCIVGSFDPILIDKGPVDITVSMDETLMRSTFLSASQVPADWTPSSAFYWMLVHTFQEAFSCIADQPDEARSMFEWVKHNTLGLDWLADAAMELPAMGLQAAGMILRLDRPSAVAYVPKLSLDQQRLLIAASAGGANQIEEYFNQFINEATDLKTRQGNAAQILDLVGSKIATLEAKITDLSAKQLPAAQKQLTENVAAFNAQRLGLRTKNSEPHVLDGSLEQARTEFETAVEKKKEEAEQKAWASAFEGLAGLGEAIGGGNPEGAAAAVESVSKVAELVEKLKKIIEALKVLAKALEAAKKIGELVETLTTGESDSSVVLPDASNATQLGDTDWKALKENWDAALDPYITDETLGSAAAQYRAQGRILLVYGEAATQAKVAISQLQNQIVQLKLNRSLYNAQAGRIRAFTKATDAEEAEVQEIAILLRQRYLDAKRDLLLEIQDYNDAYCYWALDTPPSKMINLSTRIHDIAGMAGIDGEMAKAQANRLENFTSPSTAALCHVIQPLTDDQRTALQKGDPVYLLVDIEDKAFAGYDRVRVVSVEVYFKFDDLSLQDSKNYHAIVQDHGTYRDRWHEQQFTFVAAATLTRSSAKRVDAFTKLSEDAETGLFNTVTTLSDKFTDTELAPGASDPYYQPTLFTTWVVTLPPKYADNSRINWKQAAQLILNFRVHLMTAT